MFPGSADYSLLFHCTRPQNITHDPVFAFICLCVSAPLDPWGICILFISNSTPLLGLIRSYVIWLPPNSPPCLVPLSALPISLSHTGLQTGPKITKLLPVLGLCSRIDLFLEWPPLDLSMAVSLLTFKSLFKCHLLKNHLANQSKVIFLPPILSYIPYFLPFIAFIVNSL